VVGILAANQDPVLDQPAEPVRQHRLGDVEVGLEVVEPPNAVEGVTDDQHCPALADRLERPGQRAVLLLVVLSEHAESIASLGLVIELIW